MNKVLVAALLLAAVSSIHGQTPSPSVPSAADAIASPSPPPTGQVDPEKAQLIRQVLARTKGAEMAQERILQAMAAMKLSMPRVADKYWDKYRDLISLDELRDRLAHVYDKHYTSEELNELLKFYDSPLGKKVSEEAMPILRESMEIAQDLSKKAAQSVATDIQAEQLLQLPRTSGALKAPILPRRPAVPTDCPAPTATVTPAVP